jgi:N6-L-threonylcarbamoyladenine synthase
VLILGIETSCDETAVAVIDDAGSVRANLIASQIARHQPFGGVVPEIASREHLEHLMPLLERALAEANVTLEEIEAVAVTVGPGLIGALLVGVAGAQGLSYALGIPLLAVNHLEGHIYSPYLQSQGPSIPLPERFFSLVVSGGHSSIYDVGSGGARMLNRTRDDAAGEVFDKVAKFIGLPYPGGPHVERIAKGGDASKYRFPMPQLKDQSADFSFSGLKAAAIRIARAEHLPGRAEEELQDFCASFQGAICDQIVDRLHRIWPAVDAPREVGLAGGVAANGPLRERIAAWADEHGVICRLAQRRFTTDNAAMIAFAGLQKARAGEFADALRVEARSRMLVGV